MRFSRADLPQWRATFIGIAVLSLLRVTEAVRHQGLHKQLSHHHSFAETRVTSSGCVTTGKEYRSHLLSEFSDIPDFSACQHVCNQHPQCAWFTYLSSTKRCTLHSQKPRNGQDNTHAVAGPKRCPVCVLQGYDFKGEPNSSDQGQPGLNTLSACEAGCYADKSCHYYLFQLDTKQCFFKVREQAGLALHPDANYDAGPKTCSAHWCIMTDTDYPGNDLQKVQTETREACQVKCLNDEKCEYFSWIAVNKQCWMKAGSKVPGTKKKKAGVHSGPKHCGVPTTEIAEKTKYTGAVLATHPRSVVGSFPACQLKCWENNDCAFFHYSSDGCTLSGMGAVPVADASSRGGEVAP